MADKHAKMNVLARMLSLLSDEENSVVSPCGITTALSMIAEGAVQKSLDEILSVLGYQSLDELRTAVLGVIDPPCEAFKSENTITLLKGGDHIDLLDEYRQIVSEQYSATIKAYSVSGETAICLQNAARFKATWRHRLECDVSQFACFQNVDRSICRPVFLKCTDEFRCYRKDGINSHIKAIAIPYKYQNCEIPYELVLIESDKALTETVLTEVFSNLEEKKCAVSFPQFSIEREWNLVPMMKVMGLESIFDEKSDPFDRIATKTLYAKEFGQKAEIQVDERGTVAKSTTTLMLCLKGGVKNTIENFYFKEPFYYFVRKTNTGEITFMGKVNQLSD